jgi:ribosomal protein L7/L12
MKITKELAAKLMVESATFRAYVLDSAFENDTYSLVNKIKKICKDSGRDKIAAIKAVRELSRTNPEREFYDAYDVNYYSANTLGLVDAKRIVEKYIVPLV